MLLTIRTLAAGGADPGRVSETVAVRERKEGRRRTERRTESPLERPDAADARDEDGRDDDVLLENAVVEQDADGHERRRARPDLRVEQEDVALRGALARRREALRQRDLVQERLARLGVALHEDAPDGHVLDNSPQALLERRT